MTAAYEQERVPLPELELRWRRCRLLLSAFLPEAVGLIVFSRINMYYLSGTFGNGLLWLPLEGAPVLLCRRGMERARLESPMARIHSFRSYRDIEPVLRGAGSPPAGALAVEMNGLSWTLANSFTRHLAGHQFLSGDRVLGMTRAIKSPWELAILREAGRRHDLCLTGLLPPLLRVGMSELEIAHLLFTLFLEQGHYGILRMENYGEEAYMGHIAAGDSGNYPSVFNGPLGLRGMHPATPHMGSPRRCWGAGEVLTIDAGFNLAGYQTDKTQVYWPGDPADMPTRAWAAHSFCMEMQEWIAGQLRPGVLPETIWEHCLRRAEQDGWAEGFMALGGNKVGFVGHGIGLAIDEYPVLARGFDLPLEAGMVLAVEPKIGIPGFGMVGVENTFEVTPDGGRRLTGSAGVIIPIA